MRANSTVRNIGIRAGANQDARIVWSGILKNGGAADGDARSACYHQPGSRAGMEILAQCEERADKSCNHTQNDPLGKIASRRLLLLSGLQDWISQARL